MNLIIEWTFFYAECRDVLLLHVLLFPLSKLKFWKYAQSAIMSVRSLNMYRLISSFQPVPDPAVH